ncbi:MAG TPA: hypothetical protein VGP02_17770 [Mycobacteriales bacterium]|jgi:thioesterase DpgC|nr:hypothetical protein [Mycobacteriales bacterium]
MASVRTAATELDLACLRDAYAAAETLLEGGPTAIRADRRALRVTAEALDVCRRYVAAYAREQAYCLHDPRLVANLERTWIGRAR